MSDELILYENNAGVAALTLNRPALRNALNEDVIAELTGRLEAASADASVRVIVLTADGASFSAGADLNYMRRTGRISPPPPRIARTPTNSPSCFTRCIPLSSRPLPASKTRRSAAESVWSRPATLQSRRRKRSFD